MSVSTKSANIDIYCFMPELQGLFRVGNSPRHDEENQANKDFEQHKKDKTKKHVLVEKLGILGDIIDVVKNITNLMSLFHMAEDLSRGQPNPTLYQINRQYTHYYQSKAVTNWMANHKKKCPRPPCSSFSGQSSLLLHWSSTPNV